jgi:hypothetical protein
VERSSSLSAGCTGSDNTCRAALSVTGICAAGFPPLRGRLLPGLKTRNKDGLRRLTAHECQLYFMWLKSRKIQEIHTMYDFLHLNQAKVYPTQEEKVSS